MVRIVTALITAIVVCACGATSGPNVAQTPTPAAGFKILITEKDQDVTVQAGQRIMVYLRARPGMTSWGPITSSDESVLTPVAIEVMVPRGVTVAAFQAVRPGVAAISSSAGPACSPGQACPMYAVLFSVRVTVV